MTLQEVEKVAQINAEEQIHLMQFAKETASVIVGSASVVQSGLV